MSKHRWERFEFRFGKKRTVHGFQAAIWMLASADEQKLAFDRLDAALTLVETHCPEKYTMMQSDVASILITGLPGSIGAYRHRIRMIELHVNYVLDPQTTPESLACTMVHEAQHARLRRLGFGYEEDIRGRIEGLCFRAERILARRMPNGEPLLARADAWLGVDRTPYFSKEAVRRRGIEELRELGCPDWILRTIDWKLRRRAAKSRRPATKPNGDS